MEELDRMNKMTRIQVDESDIPVYTDSVVIDSESSRGINTHPVNLVNPVEMSGFGFGL